ncbi:MAG TPA: RNA 2',3'-cyclic phosphodiesterase [Acidimicrobiales bacterium]|nr:RNA 2',3'-cyclic phosphodiesterase [Acidimicrobiales bacterium]
MRLFVAVWPPADVVAQLAALPRPEIDGVRWTTPDQWHVTLRFLGELGGPEELSSVLRGTALPRASAVLGPVAEAPSPTLLWFPVSGLDALAAAVIGATGGVGRPAEREFRGHLTLARARPRAPRSLLRRLPRLELAARWEVGEVTVVRSTTGGAGSRYDVVERFPTGA